MTFREWVSGRKKKKNTPVNAVVTAQAEPNKALAPQKKVFTVAPTAVAPSEAAKTAPIQPKAAIVGNTRPVRRKKTHRCTCPNTQQKMSAGTRKRFTALKPNASKKVTASGKTLTVISSKQIAPANTVRTAPKPLTASRTTLVSPRLMPVKPASVTPKTAQPVKKVSRSRKVFKTVSNLDPTVATFNIGKKLFKKVRFGRRRKRK